MIKKLKKHYLWLYYAFVFLQSLSFFSAVLVPFFTQWGGISLFQVQILQSWFLLWFFLLEVPTGAVADYLGRKHSLVLGATTLIFATFIYGSIPNFKIFLLGELLFALGGALLSGADEALLYDTLAEMGREKESQKFFGRTQSIHLAGMLLAAPIGGLIAAKFGLNAPMQFTAISYIVAVLIGLTLHEPKRFEKELESKRYWQIVKEGFAFFFNHQQLRALAANAIIVSISAYFVIWFYQPLLEKVGFPIKYFGLVHSFMVLSEIAVSAGFEKLEKLSGSQENYIKVSAVLTAIPFLLVAVFPNLATIFIFVSLAGGFGLTRLKYISSFANEFIPSGQRATVLSSISMFRRFALATFNPLAGFLADRSLAVALFGLGILPLTTLAFPWLKKEKLISIVKAYNKKYNKQARGETKKEKLN